jgi:hypothetical protein
MTSLKFVSMVFIGARSGDFPKLYLGSVVIGTAERQSGVCLARLFNAESTLQCKS